MNSLPDRRLSPRVETFSIVYRVGFADPMTESKELLAVLGRGIQLVDGEWTPTQDFEIYNARTHYTTPKPIDARNPACRVGGGRLNLDATKLFLTRKPLPVVLGFAHPAEYLQAVNGPTESEVLSSILEKEYPTAQVTRWTWDGSGKSNTEVEVLNVLDYASRNGVSTVHFLSIAPHLERVLALATRANKPRVLVNAVSSERILMSSGSEHVERIFRLITSRPYQRTMRLEAQGTKRIEQGTYV